MKWLSTFWNVVCLLCQRIWVSFCFMFCKIFCPFICDPIHPSFCFKLKFLWMSLTTLLSFYLLSVSLHQQGSHQSQSQRRVSTSPVVTWSAHGPIRALELTCTTWPCPMGSCECLRMGGTTCTHRWYWYSVLFGYDDEFASKKAKVDQLVIYFNG